MEYVIYELDLGSIFGKDITVAVIHLICAIVPIRHSNSPQVSLLIQRFVMTVNCPFQKAFSLYQIIVMHYS